MSSTLGRDRESSGGSRRLIHQGPTEVQRWARCAARTRAPLGYHHHRRTTRTAGVEPSANDTGQLIFHFGGPDHQAPRVSMKEERRNHRAAGGSSPTQHARVRCLCAVIVDLAPIQPRAVWQAQSLYSFASTLTERWLQIQIVDQGKCAGPSQPSDSPPHYSNLAGTEGARCEQAAQNAAGTIPEPQGLRPPRVHYSRSGHSRSREGRGRGGGREVEWGRGRREAGIRVQQRF
jgi:hypothetical protein